MIAESSEVQTFRQIIGDAPELTIPCQIGRQLWPYTVCKVDEKSDKGILETKPNELGRFIRTEYSANYGLAAKKYFLCGKMEKNNL